MPRKKKSASQSSFLKREIPEMPEGYYSSGPNPNLRCFVEKHATPYDPETDDYDVLPSTNPSPPPRPRPSTTCTCTGAKSPTALSASTSFTTPSQATSCLIPFVVQVAQL